jgi:nicotinamidase-related amidase
MKLYKKVLISTAVLIIGIVGFMAWQISSMSRPTKGNMIETYVSPHKALLVIDIQEDFTGTTAKPPFPYRDSARLIETVNRITEAAARDSMLIIYIRQELDGFVGKLLSNLLAGGVAIKGNPGTEIDKRVSVISSHIFPKPRSDSFSNPDLDRLLIEHQVNELFLVGLDAGGCVHNTARGGLNRGYKVNIITDAIVLREEAKWDALLDQYREEGINLIMTEEITGAEE